MTTLKKCVSLVLGITLLWGACAGAVTNISVYDAVSFSGIRVTSHQDNCVIRENSLLLGGISGTDGRVEIYVDGEYRGQTECIQGTFSYMLSDLAEGKRCVTVQAKSESDETIAESIFINVALKNHDFVGSPGSTLTFDSLPEWNDLSSDTSRLDILNNIYALGFYPHTLSVSRTEGASGKDGDYALYIEKPPSVTDGTKASLKYFETNKEIIAESGTVTFDFDLKLNSNRHEFRFFGFPPWHGGHALIYDGKLAGTNVSFPENKWVHLNMVYDLTNSGGDYTRGKWYVTLSYDEVSIKAVDGADAVANMFHTGMRITLQPYGGITDDTQKIGFALDNFSITYDDENIYIEDITSIDKLNNEKTVYNLIPADTEKILLTLSREAEASPDDVNLFLDGEYILPVSVTSMGRKLQIELPALCANKTLTVMLKKSIGYVTGDISVSLPIAEKNGYFANLKYSDNYCTMQFGSLYTGNKSVFAVVAQYSDGRLIQADVKNINEYYRLFAKYSLNPEFKEAKAFVFESDVSLKPMLNTVNAVPGIVKSSRISNINDDIKVKKLLKDDVVFMTETNAVYFGGAKTTPEAYGCKQGVYIDGEYMIDASLADIIFEGISYDSSLITEHDGTLYLPPGRYAAQELSKYVYTDKRGYILVSDENRNYSNSELAGEKFEDADTIHRYMQFQRPDVNKIYNDFKKTSGTSRPRLFVKKADIPAFRQKLDSYADTRTALTELLTLCDSYMDTPPIEYEIPDGLRLFQSCEKVKIRLINLGVAYMATDDEKYAARAWLEMENALNWSDWNVNKHFLDSGEIGPGIAFAYDVFYDYLTNEQKAFIRERVERLYIDFAIGLYTGESSFSSFDNRMINSNWGAVCSASMLLCALTFMGEESRNSEFMQKCEFLAENSIRSLEFPLGNLYPDGASGEGVGYWEYYITHLGWSINALRNMCGSDYGLLSSPGFDKAPEYMIHLHSPAGIYNYSAENGTGCYYPPEAILISRFCGRAEQEALIETYRKSLGVKSSATWLMWYEPVKSEAYLDSYPTDKFFDGEQIVTLRSDWSRDASYVGIRGGANEVTSHFDKGSFIYVSDRVRWFIETGAENKNVSGGSYGENGLTLYKRRAEGHNSIVINPTASDPGQSIGGVTRLTKMLSEPHGAITVFDLADVYREQVNSYSRGFYFGDDRNSITVQDELELKEDDNAIYCFLHTYGNITIGDDGKSAVITQNGKTLYISVICDAAEWSLEKNDTTPLFEENIREGEYSRDGMSKLTLKGTAKGKLNISIKASTDKSALSTHSLVPIENWTL